MQVENAILVNIMISPPRHLMGRVIDIKRTFLFFAILFFYLENIIIIITRFRYCIRCFILNFAIFLYLSNWICHNRNKIPVIIIVVLKFLLLYMNHYSSITTKPIQNKLHFRVTLIILDRWNEVHGIVQYLSNHLKMIFITSTFD